MQRAFPALDLGEGESGRQDLPLAALGLVF